MSVVAMRRIDFNNPMINKPANLQNSAVLRMLEEEEDRRRSGQPGSLKRVAWPPNELEGFTEQEPVQSQGGPLYSSKTAPGIQSNQAPIQQPITSPVQQQPQLKSPIIANNTFQPIISPSPSSQSAANSPYQSAPLSPNVNQSSKAPVSPVSLTSLAKPWSPQSQSTPHFKPVQPPSTTVQSYQSSKHYEYQYQSQEQTRETQTVVLPPYQPVYQPSVQETTFQQYQTPTVAETQRTFEIIKTQEQHSVPQPKFSNLNQSEIPTKLSQENSVSNQTQQEISKLKSFTQKQETSILTPKKFEPTPVPSEQFTTPPIQSQPAAAAQGVAQNQVPVQRYQQPPKQVEPPPSTITLRPQAPVRQAPPPLITSQPATATLRGGKNLRGDLKWPPENVRERMAADAQHLIELAKGPAVKPRKNCKDYSPFFAKHALNQSYPGYKIPPGTQFYDHNPVM